MHSPSHIQTSEVLKVMPTDNNIAAIYQGMAAQEKTWWQSASIVALVVLLFWGLFRLLRALIAIAARDAAPYALRTRWV